MNLGKVRRVEEGRICLLKVPSDQIRSAVEVYHCKGLSLVINRYGIYFIRV